MSFQIRRSSPDRSCFEDNEIAGDHTVDRLAHAQALSVVHEGSGGAALGHLLELAAVLPGVGPGAVGKRIANGVVGNRRAVVGGELVFPVVIAVVLLWYLPKNS